MKDLSMWQFDSKLFQQLVIIIIITCGRNVYFCLHILYK